MRSSGFNRERTVLAERIAVLTNLRASDGEHAMVLQNESTGGRPAGADRSRARGAGLKQRKTNSREWDERLSVKALEARLERTRKLWIVYGT
jgi:hypothetical protein